MKLQTPAKPITADEYHRLAEEGAFDNNERVELLEGEIVFMVPPGPNHGGKTKRALEAFTPLVASRKITLSIQDPIALDGLSEPEPDIALLKRRDDFYENQHPRPEDVLLAIEVADTSLQKDRDRKIPLYGSRGVRESWLVDLNAETVTAYRVPGPKGYLEEKTQDLRKGDGGGGL
jgi:Uma2 family endonuclease